MIIFHCEDCLLSSSIHVKEPGGNAESQASPPDLGIRFCMSSPEAHVHITDGEALPWGI